MSNRTISVIAKGAASGRRCNSGSAMAGSNDAARRPSGATAGAAKPPVRMAMLYMPNGVNTAAWYPQGIGRDFTLSPTLEPLSDLKNDIVVLSNLWNAGIQRWRRPLRKRGRYPHLRNDQEDARRRSGERHFCGSARGADALAIKRLCPRWS